MTSDQQKLAESLERVRLWLVETAHIRTDAFVMPRAPLELPDLDDVLADIETLPDESEDDERWETLSSRLSDDVPSVDGGDVSAFLSDAEFSRREGGGSISESFSDINAADADLRGLQPDLRSAPMAGGSSSSGSTISSLPSDLSLSRISSESTLSVSDDDVEPDDVLGDILDAYTDDDAESSNASSASTAHAARPGPERDAAIRDGILGLDLPNEPLGPEDEAWLLGRFSLIDNPLDWAAASRMFDGRPELMTPAIRAAIVAKVLDLSSSEAFGGLTYASLAVADIVVNTASSLERFSDGDLETLKACAEGLPDRSLSPRRAKTVIGMELERRVERPPVPVPPDETPAGKRLREIGARAGSLPRGGERDAAIREGIQDAGEGIEAFDPVEEGRLLDLWRQIDNPQDQARALTLFHENPELFTWGVGAAVVDWADGLRGADPFTNESAGLANGLVNCMPFFEILPTDQLEALKRSGAGLPDTYPEAVRAMRAIDEELERRVERPPVPVPPDETPAGKRLREIGAKAGSLPRGGERDAALREGIQDAGEGIEAFDPVEEGRLLDLWQQIDNPQDQARALTLFHENPRLFTQGVGAAVVGWAGGLRGAAAFTNESAGLANGLVNCMPFFEILPTDQLEALKRSGAGLPDTYPEAVRAMRAIDEELERRVERPPVPVPPDETPAGKRLREIRARAMRTRPELRDAAIRDGIEDLIGGISVLDPADEGQLLGLFQEIGNEQQQAATLKLFGAKPNLATPAVSEAAARWVLRLGQGEPFVLSEGGVSMANALADGFPLRSFTQGQLRVLLSSLEGLSGDADMYPQNGKAKADIRALLASGAYRPSDAGSGGSPGQGPGGLPDPGPSIPPDRVAVRSSETQNSAGQGRRQPARMEPAEQETFVEGLNEYGNRLGGVDRAERARVLDQIDRMSARGSNAQWAAGNAIVICAGPSVGGLSLDEGRRLVGNAVEIETDHVALEALWSLKSAWPDGEPSFNDVLAEKDFPAWARNIDEIIDLLNQRAKDQDMPAQPAPPKKTPAKKARKR